MDKIDRIRHIVQGLWAAATNSYVAGFMAGKIYGGDLKVVCSPGLNCYSCPGALLSCPIGALQAVLGDRKFQFSCYIFGFLTLVGATMGRFVCGWLCPFGFLQDMLHRIPFPKKIKTFKGDRALRYLKYLVLLVLVILLPMFLVDAAGSGSPWFCKVVCPAGTLEGGIPLVLLNAPMREIVGFLYAWKLFLLVAVILLSLMIYRPFCKYICPLGAIYALFNPVSLYRVKPGPGCARCKMGAKTNDRECIRCVNGPSLAKVRRGKGEGKGK